MRPRLRAALTAVPENIRKMGTARSEKLSRVAVDVRTEIQIERPRDQVAAFAVDPTNAPAWYKNIQTVDWETPPPLAVGSRLRFRAQFLGRTLAYTYEVRELEPGARLVMATAHGPFPMETTYTWADAGAGATKMGLRNRGEPSGFASVAAPVIARAIQRANNADLRRLKALLESSPPRSDRCASGS